MYKKDAADELPAPKSAKTKSRRAAPVTNENVKKVKFYCIV